MAAAFNTFKVLQPMLKDTYSAKKPKKIKVFKPKAIKPPKELK